jgi:hypothetical protein
LSATKEFRLLGAFTFAVGVSDDGSFSGEGVPLGVDDAEDAGDGVGGVGWRFSDKDGARLV